MDEATRDVDGVDVAAQAGGPATPPAVAGDEGDARDAAASQTGPGPEEAWPASRRRGSRQTRENGNPRSLRHVVRVHPDTELALVAKAAAAGNISVPRLLVQSALAGGAEAATSRVEFADELYRLVRLIGKVGVNVNQIARATNATLEEQPETIAAMEAVSRVCARAEAFLAQLDTGIGHGLEPLDVPATGTSSGEME